MDATEQKMGLTLADAMAKVVREMPSLRKDAENKFAGYSYTPIDTYYEVAAKLCAKHGLVMTTREMACELVEIAAAPDKRGGRDSGPAQPKTFTKTVYAADMHLAGMGCVTDVGRVTVFHALTGPQTSGSSASYAEKVFYRTLFKVVTGEPDGDAEQPYDTRSVQAAPDDRFPGETARAPSRQAERQAEPAREPDPPARAAPARAAARVPPRVTPRAPTKRPPVQEATPEASDAPEETEAGAYEPEDEPMEKAGNGADRDPIELTEAAKRAVERMEAGLPVMRRNHSDWSLPVAIFEAWAPQVESIPELRAWWQENNFALERMKEMAPEQYDEVLDIFKRRRGELPKEA